MKLDESKLSIANLRDMLARGDLVANKDYQRAPGLWPNASRSYFIDTILEGFPFPKIYLHEYLDRKSKKIRTEIVDGQQRITTIQDFLLDKFALGKNSPKFNGLKFSELEEDVQDRFIFYTVSTDVIRDAGRPEILQMFRRMNAYTLPLNAAEKRHSEFFGEFKDTVTRLLDNLPILSEWGIYTTRQLVRMADAAFLADLILAIESGVGSTSDTKLQALYRQYDHDFPNAALLEERILEIFHVIAQDFSEIRSSHMTKPYAIYALFCAMYHNKYGLPSFEQQTGFPTIGRFSTVDAERATSNLLQLAAAHESNDMGRFPEYVEAMNGGSNRERQRMVRISYLCRALRNEL